VAHELLHVVYDHLPRFGTRNKQLANIAADYVVNQDLIEFMVGQRITTVPCLYDKKYSGMCFEEVYDDLLKNAKKMDVDELSKMVLDEHKDCNDMTEEEKAVLKDEIREAMLSAAESVGIGNVPAGIQRLIKDFTEPKMDWKEMLRQQIESQIKSDYSFMRPSRRSWHMDAILPSQMKQPTVSVHCAVDVSGSIGAVEMRDFFSEIKGMMDQYESYSISIGTWDTKFYGFTEFTSDNGDDLLSYVPIGGGGTDAGSVWRWMKDNEVEPKQLIVFTDMEIPGGCWGDEDYCDTSWIAYKTKRVAPFGETYEYT
jgi:predicted metal-dependent peptidase